MNYLFSIIMPIYKAEKWLEEAIDSIINQKNINFKEVQLILVNDCSPDGSEQICLKYSKKYENILYLKNDTNLGLANTRNKGLKYIKGEYINFFDPDDILSTNTLSEVYKFFKLNESQGIQLAHVSIPLVYFEAMTGLHSKYSLLGKKNRVINLDLEGSNFILSSASSFYSNKLIQGLEFDPSVFGDEDTLFNFQLYEKHKLWGYVVENEVIYYYRQRKEGGSQVNQSKIKPEAFYTPIQLIETVKVNKKTELFYELCIYQLRSRLQNIKPEIFENIDQYNNIISEYRKIISQIPLDFILNQTKFLSDINAKLSFLTCIFKEKLEFSCEEGYIYKGENKIFKINNLPIEIKNIEIINNRLIIDVLFNNFDITDIKLVILDENKSILKPNIEFYTESSYIYKSGGIPSAQKILYSRFELPLFKENKYKFYFRSDKNGYIYICNRLQTYSESPFLANGIFNTKKFKLYVNTTKTSISLFNRTFFVENYNLLTKLTDRIKTFWLIYKKHGAKKWLRLFKLNQPKYWLFNDRPINANDNAEYFFEYINKNNRNLAKYCYFVLSKNSPDIDRIRKIGNVVIQNSFKHKFLYLNAKYIFTSHLAISFFKPISFKFLKYYNDLIDSKIIWLQHGITMNNIETGANKLNKRVSKVITCAKFEDDIFKQHQFFYPNHDILSVGFSRYDKLRKKKENEKIILVMPTWRSFLSGRILANGLHAEQENFKESDYFLNYSSFLSNPILINKLKESGYKIIFVLHPGFKQYAYLFNYLQNDVIQIMTKVSFSYYKLFNQGSLLITDYSSVFFDFAYTQKPCLFFQFDEEQFYGKHYKKGVFDFATMAPGKIVKTSNDLVTQVLKFIDNGMQLESEYLQRIESLYMHFDSKNSERLLYEILKDDK